MTPARPTRVALALGSGGARGYAHIGVIDELRDRGHQVVSVAGSSMGAVVGGMFAAGQLDQYRDWVLGLSQRGVLQQLDPSHTNAGVLRAERVLTRMVELFGDHRIEDLPIRFTAVAVDLLAGREVWLDAGPLDRAIRASIAIPGVVTPALLDGRLLVDGGVLNPVPVAATAVTPADLVVAVSLGGKPRQPPATPARRSADRRQALTPRLTPRSRGPGTQPADDGEPLPSVTMLEVVRLSSDAAQSALTRYGLAAYPPDVLISVPMDACHTGDFHKAAELIELGRTLAREALDGNPAI